MSNLDYSVDNYRSFIDHAYFGDCDRSFRFIPIT
ncbi:hypothetical protein VCSRO151_3460 [Vibrio cholerae]|nr:hypothetical protein VCSRO151_3460 [Vibrio cholerae]